VGDPRLIDQVNAFVRLEKARFALVHFNNGMHGWGYNESQYQRAFPVFVDAIQHIGSPGTLIWATTTAVKTESSPGPTNARIDARNAIASSIITVRHLPVDDQHALMLKHADHYLDFIHFDETGSEIQGQQAAATIVSELGLSKAR
jgi:hypothetical protein